VTVNDGPINPMRPYTAQLPMPAPVAAEFLLEGLRHVMASAAGWER
jgi:hypothetical protein